MGCGCGLVVVGLSVICWRVGSLVWTIFGVCFGLVDFGCFVRWVVCFTLF